MAQSIDQMAEFMGYLRERSRMNLEHAAMKAEPEMLAFIEYVESSQQGQAEREAAPEYQAELYTTLQRLGGKVPICQQQQGQQGVPESHQ